MIYRVTNIKINVNGVSILFDSVEIMSKAKDVQEELSGIAGWYRNSKGRELRDAYQDFFEQMNS